MTTPRAGRWAAVTRPCQALVLIGMLAGGGRGALAQPALPGPPAVLVQPATAVPAPLVAVKQFQVHGVSLLPAGEVERALAGLTGQRTVEDLHRAAATVQALYQRAGYGAVLVYLPPQEVSSGVVTLQVIEGRVSAVRVEGAGPGVPDALVLARLPALQQGQTPRLDQLDQQLRIANDNPARRMRLVLLPGQQPEQTEAEVGVEPGAQRQFSLELDNTGARSSGRARMALGWRDADTTGHGDVAELRLLLAPANPRRFAALGLNYRLPLPTRAMVLDAYALVSDTRSGRIPTAAGTLDFSGRGHLLGLRATHYLLRLQGLDQRVAVGIERRAQRNQCAIGTLSGDVCGGAAGSLHITPLMVEYSLAGEAPWPVALSVAWLQGLDLGSQRSNRAAFNTVRPGARPAFSALRLQGSLLQPLGGTGWTATARAAAQWSAQPLVPAMQFGAGGRESVRGYEERELAADHGAALSLELSAPAWQPAAWPGSQWRPLLFADAAALRNRDGAPCSGTQLRCSLASAGAGLRLELGSTSVGLDIAHTLRAAGTTARDRTWGHLWLRLVH